jgi:hypothetical protein
VAIQKLVKTQKQLAQERIEEERMHDVLLLLSQLLENEEVTVKLIINCLYDVGSVNLINKKIRSYPINAIALGIAKMSKPVFRIVAITWVNKNVPRLATNWLRSQVSFPNLEDKKPQVSVDIASKAHLEPLTVTRNNSIEEIKRLRSEVRYLTGISVTALIALASTLIWIIHSPQPKTIIFHATNSNGNLATKPMK